MPWLASGATPHERRRDFLARITLVMGQRNQLFWDLPAMVGHLALFAAPLRRRQRLRRSAARPGTLWSIGFRPARWEKLRSETTVTWSFLTVTLARASSRPA